MSIKLNTLLSPIQIKIDSASFYKYLPFSFAISNYKLSEYSVCLE
ncbi:hypothetical protein C1A50_2554 [Paenibacillus polymyxa]|nr:hypothetical protein C1A50_2554 [Paenibacillus polymyxa]